MNIRIPRLRRSAGLARWPLVVIALSPAVAVWAGWVELGRMTGFGVVHPLPGILDDLRVDTSITLPIGVEAYATYALAVLLSARDLSRPTRIFAGCSAAAALLLGMLGQVTYHLLQADGRHTAPWEVTTVVACLPVAVLGAAAALWHMVHRDSTRATSSAASSASNGASTVSVERSTIGLGPAETAVDTTVSGRGSTLDPTHATQGSTLASNGASGQRRLSVQPFDARASLELLRPVTYSTLASNGASNGTSIFPGDALIERSTFAGGGPRGIRHDSVHGGLDGSIDTGDAGLDVAPATKRRVTLSQRLITICDETVRASGPDPTQLDRARVAYRLIATETGQRPTGAELAYILGVTDSTARDYRQAVERELGDGPGA